MQGEHLAQSLPRDNGLSLSHELDIELRSAAKVPRGVETRAFDILTSFKSKAF